MVYIKHRCARIAEVGLMLVALWWGVVLVFPEQTFHNPAYIEMLKVMPEVYWSIVSFSIGVILAVGLLKNSILIKGMGLILSVGFWTFVSVTFWLGDHHTTGTSYIIWSVMAFWSYIHLVKVGDGSV